MNPRHKRFLAALLYSIVLYVGTCLTYSYFIPKMSPLVYLVALFVAIAAYFVVYSALVLLVFDHVHLDKHYNRIAHFGHGFSKQFMEIYDTSTRTPKTMIMVFCILSFSSGTATLYPLGHSHPQWGAMFFIAGLLAIVFGAIAKWFASRLEEAGLRWCKLVWDHTIDEA
jgi:hypothetical protein